MGAGEQRDPRQGREPSRFHCPICRKPVDPPDTTVPKHLRFFPFCSNRCRLIDLGAWLDADYRIPSRLEDQEDEPPAKTGDEPGGR